jgi:hypothetical protein
MRGTHDSIGALPSSKVGSRAAKHVVVPEPFQQGGGVQSRGTCSSTWHYVLLPILDSSMYVGYPVCIVLTIIASHFYFSSI